MAFEGRLALGSPVAALAGHLPRFETWLRLNPEWTVLALRPGATAADLELRLRLEPDEREACFASRVEPNGDHGWRLTLDDGSAPRCIELELAPAGAASELVLRDSAAGADDADARRNLALWLRATLDYALLGRGTGWRSRLGKWLLDRVWLRMSLAGRRVVILVLAYEVVGFAFLLAWLAWERIAA